FQVLSFLGECRLSVGPYLLGKFLHGLLSALLVPLFSSLLFSPARETAVPAGAAPVSGLSLSLAAASPQLLLSFCSLVRERRKKSF
ncbi:MAG: hypothetical protein IKX85_04065, partial [Clostridia bacterium]|nr:hypothetical protein [Clostridia bacterium]